MQNRQHSQDGSGSLGRRQLLGLLAVGGLGSCVRRGRALLAHDTPEQVSVSIKAVPADADPRATRIARTLAESLSAVGVDATVVPTSPERLYRDVLVNNAFDLYVGRFPERADPDFLRPLLHSEFVSESGWQNPFGFADTEVDRLLEFQRDQAGARRRETLATIQREIARRQPFSVVAFADEIRTTRTDRVTGWEATTVHTPSGYLSLSVDEGNASSGESADRTGTTRDLRDRRVTVTLSDPRPLKNLNPLAVAFRGEGTITDLLYDPLGRRLEGDVRPWLAESWSWVETDGDRPVLEIRLRDGLQWHDGEPLDADDVAFTYRFLRDTSLGSLDSPVPAPRFRGRSSFVTDALALDDRTVRLSFRTTNRRVARRALTVPILPTHVWEPTATKATVGGIDTGATVTEALVWDNREPIGSGPFELDAFEVRERLTLAPAENHFLTRADDAHLRGYRGGATYDRLTFARAPSSATAVSMVAAGDADGTASAVLPGEISTIGRDPELDLHVSGTRSFYHVGYNARRAPLGNPKSRRAIARLLDKDALVSDVFEGFAQPAASPLARHESLAPELAWNGADPEVPFLGESGTLDVERARAAFRDAGHRYSDDGRLLVA